MTKALYFECSSGISGDMCAAALLDAGASEDVVCRALESLDVPEFEINITRVEKSSLDVCDFDVVLDEGFDNHDHDMAWLYGVTPDIDVDGNGVGDGQFEHVHDDHDNAHDHSGSDHNHEHRNLADIVALIDGADMSDSAKAVARRIFEILAEAEAKAHATSIDEVHFHEVGAVDSIADIVAIAAAFDDLDIDEVVVCELAEGRGFIRCRHGLIPVPVPAVANIVSTYDIALHILDVQGEHVTPTGAAVVAALRTTDTLPEHFVIERVGMGAGKREYETPGILRAMIISY